jgi:hypothetical protein
LDLDPKLGGKWDPDPKLCGKWDPDKKKIVTDPQHCLKVLQKKT